MKPGIYSTEFWLALVGVLSLLSLALTGNVDGAEVVPYIAGASGVYTTARAYLKGKDGDAE